MCSGVPLLHDRRLVRYKNAEGKWCVAGGPGLKGTQSYTAEFGRGLALWCFENSNSLAKAGTESELGLESEETLSVSK